MNELLRNRMVEIVAHEKNFGIDFLIKIMIATGYFEKHFARVPV